MGKPYSKSNFVRPAALNGGWGNVPYDAAMSGGGIKRTDGTFCSLNNVVRRFGYIIADLTPSLVKVLKKHDFKNSWNKDIYVCYRDNEEIFIQVMGYNTLIENAKKRNDAFFKVLFDE